MTLEEMKAYINENKEDPELNKYIDSLADRRVTTAIEKAEKRFSMQIDERVRAEAVLREQQKADKEKLLNSRMDFFNEKFQGLDEGSKKAGLALLGDFVAYADNDAFESKITQTIGTVKQIQEDLTRERFGKGNEPMAGTAPSMDADVQSFRAAMGLKN